MATNDALRSEEMAQKYKEHRASGIMENGCVLCLANPLKSFQNWKIIQNNFPYDRIAETHHMIIPLRHVDETGLTREESDELQTIKYSTLQDYDIIVEATKRTKSIPAHFHLHLITTK